MPHLDDDALAHLASLARIDLDPSGRDALRADLERVLDYVDRLAAYDDATVAPLRHPAHDGAPLDVDALRSDDAAPEEPSSTPPFDDAVARREGRVVVPRTVDTDG